MLAGFLSVEDPELCRDLSLGEVMLKAGWRLQIPACGSLDSWFGRVKRMKAVDVKIKQIHHLKDKLLEQLLEESSSPPP